MKNSNFKSSFISTLAVTVVGVLLFGVNAALGETPLVSPPGSGTAPTFTGLNLTGSVRNETSGVDYITVEDGLNVTGDALFNGDLTTIANELDIGTNLHIVGSIKNPSSGDKPVKVDDGLEVSGNLTASGYIKTPSGSNVKFDDGIYVNGLTSTFENLGSSSGHSFNLDGSLTFTNMGGSALTSSFRRIIGITGLESPNGKTLGIKALDNNGSTASEITLDPIGKDVLITGDIAAGNGSLITFSEDVAMSGNLSVDGKLTSTVGIGTFTRFISDSDGISSNGDTPYTVSTGTGVDKTLSCPSGSKVISCQVKPAEVTGYDIQNFSLSAYMDTALTYCKATVHNGSTTEKKFLIYQICFDSTQ